MYYNLSKICSMCLSNRTFLYKSSMVDRVDRMKLIDKLNFVVFEKNYVQENIARNICDDCKHMIRTGYRFKKMCQKNYNKLQQYVERRKNKNVDNNGSLEVNSKQNDRDRYRNNDKERKRSNSASTSSSTSEIKTADFRSNTADNRNADNRRSTAECRKSESRSRTAERSRTVERSRNAEFRSSTSECRNADHRSNTAESRNVENRSNNAENRSNTVVSRNAEHRSNNAENMSAESRNAEHRNNIVEGKNNTVENRNAEHRSNTAESRNAENRSNNTENISAESSNAENRSNIAEGKTNTVENSNAEHRSNNTENKSAESSNAENRSNIAEGKNNIVENSNAENISHTAERGNAENRNTADNSSNNVESKNIIVENRNAEHKSNSTENRSEEIRNKSNEKNSETGEYKGSNSLSVSSLDKTPEKEIKSGDKSSKQDKTYERRKSVSNSFVEKHKPNKDSKLKDQIRNSRKSTSFSDESTDLKPKNRKLSAEFVIKPPQEKVSSPERRNSEPTLSFNKKYYGFTTNEIQSAHEYLFNIKILLKFVTLSNAVETQNVTDGINKRKLDLNKKLYKYDISKYHTLLNANPNPVDSVNNKPSMNNEKNYCKQNKRKIKSIDTANKKIKETPIASSSNQIKSNEENNQQPEINNNYDDDEDDNNSEIVDDLSSEDVIKQDTDDITALPCEEVTREDHLQRKTYPGPDPEMAQDGQIHPYIPKAIKSTEELSKIISNPTAVEKKTLTVPVLPTESLRPENLGNSFQQFNKAMNEVRSIINKDRLFECQFCDRTFTKKQFLLLHYIVHCEKEGSEYKCAVCKNRFADELTMKQHLFTHNDTPTPQCYICNRSFKREYCLALHILASHKGIRAFKCHICDKSFARHSTLKTHLKRHSAYKDYQCKVCGTFLASKCGLQRHMAIHTGNKPYSCKLCDKAYAYRCQLTDHIVRQHYNKDIKEKKLT